MNNSKCVDEINIERAMRVRRSKKVMRGITDRFAILLLGVLVSFSLPSWAATVGKTAPKTVLENIRGGGPVSLEAMRGKVVLVDFWASWCPPCLKSLPILNNIRSELKDYGFEVFAINVDESSKEGAAFFKKLNVQYPSGLDSKGRMAELWNVQAMPTSYLIDRQGVVRLIHKGFKEKDVPHLKQEILKLIKE